MDETKPKEYIEQWEQISLEEDKNSNGAGKYYDKYILPYVKEVFVKNSKHLLKGKNYDGLILTVGGSPEPLILSICAIKPNRVGLLYTENRKDSLDRIHNNTDLTVFQMIEAAKKVDGSKTTEIYQAIMNLYTEWGKPENIAVGVTGGKKSMVSGAAIAGAVLEADIYYVDTDKKNKLNKPEPGSEYLRLLDNPYTVFGDLEVNKAKDLYDRHDYAGAHRIFNQLTKEVRDPSLSTVYEAYRYLCATYEAWDNLDIDKAIENLKHLLGILDRFSSVLKQLGTLCDSMPNLREHKEALKNLKDIFDTEEQAFKIPDGFHFAFMLYHNAIRREAQGKLDTACLILYRLLEWIEQHRLAQYCIITSQPNYSKSGTDETELLCGYKTKRQALYQGVKVSSLPNPIALIDGFLILNALNDEIVKSLKWPALKGQIEIRNQSVYAHGMSKINEKSFAAFKKTVEELFTKAQQIANIDAETFTKQHKFITPLP